MENDQANTASPPSNADAKTNEGLQAEAATPDANNAAANNATSAPPAGSSSAQKRPQRRGGNQKPDHAERALFCLGLKNPLRAFCIRIVDSK